MDPRIRQRMRHVSTKQKSNPSIKNTDVPKGQSSYHARLRSRDLKSPNFILFTYIDGSDYQNELSAIEIPDLPLTLVVLSQKNWESNKTSPPHSIPKQTDYQNGRINGSNNTSD